MNSIIIRSKNDKVRHILNLDAMHSASMDGNKLSVHFNDGHIWYIEGENAQDVADHIALLLLPWYWRFWRWIRK